MSIQIDLSGKIALVMGVANKHSIAWAIAQKLSEAGCQIVLTYQNERLEKSVKELAGQINCSLTIRCDVEKDNDIAELFKTIKEEIGYLDFLIHSIAFAPSSELKGKFIETSRDGFLKTLEISAYSLIPLSREFAKIAKPDGSIVALTFQASERVFPAYKIMAVAKAALENIVQNLAFELGENIRVNAVSPGPIETVSARAIAGFMSARQTWQERSPRKKAIDPTDVANTVLFLSSDLSKLITGEIIHVDAGYHIMGA